jgi:dolichyl-phosphate-mannose--protein O-mannosyl transferase
MNRNIKNVPRVIAVVLMGYVIGYVTYGAAFVSWLTVDQGINSFIAQTICFFVSIPISLIFDLLDRRWLGDFKPKQKISFLKKDRRVGVPEPTVV